MKTATLRLTSGVLGRLLSHIHRGDGLEHLAFLSIGTHESGERIALLAREVWCIPDDDLVHGAEADHLELKPEAMVQVVNRAVREGVGLIEVHNHGPHDLPCRFSPSDHRGFCEVVPYMLSSLGLKRYGALVLSGPNDADGLVWTGDPHKPVPLDEIRLIGPAPAVVRPTGSGLGPLVEPSMTEDDLERFDRQVRAFGRHGQARLGCLAVAIVGLGGIGSILAHQLARLGVRSFILVDYDRAELTNLNRLDGAGLDDVYQRRLKVEIAARQMRSINTSVRVLTLAVPVYAAAAIEAIAASDLIITATDDSASRFAVNQVALAYLRPLLDVATGINPAEAQRIEAGGRYTLCFPGQGCLLCAGAIDAGEACAEFELPQVRQSQARAGYIRGSSDPSPSVMSLNSLVASAAVLEAMAWASGMRPPFAQVYFDALAGSASKVSYGRNPACLCCSELLGRGDQADLIAKYHRWGETDPATELKPTAPHAAVGSRRGVRVWLNKLTGGVVF